MNTPNTIHLKISGSTELVTDNSKTPRPLSQILAENRHPINTRCNGRGLCNACQAQLLSGETIHVGNGEVTQAPATIKTCQQSPRPGTTITLEVPERALLRHKPAIVSNFKINIPRSLAPLAPPPPNEETPWIGAAVDIGTTTVALLLSDLRTGRVLASDTAYNAQIRQGEDLITRIQLCAQDKANILLLQKAVLEESIQPLIEKTCKKAGLSPKDIYSLVVAANTTMLHLFAGVDPTPIGVHPFTPAFLNHRAYSPAELGLSFGPDSAQVHLLPGPAAYVGADISSGLLASGMFYEEGPVLFVDVGTNGEIVLKNKERLLSTATAAGPAFEGAGLTHGTRATEGAIDRIRIDKDTSAVSFSVIGNSAAHGICGTAYVDFLAEGRRANLLTEHGRINPPGTRSCVIAPASQGTQSVEISVHDIARLLQAKAAVAAGITTLLDLEGITASEIKTLYLAGGFGMHLDIANTIAIGLLPGFTPGQVITIGNSSLAGALATLEDRNLLGELKLICSQIKSVELNLQPGFEDSYIDQLALP